jgi:hypothetical protein
MFDVLLSYTWLGQEEGTNIPIDPTQQALPHFSQQFRKFFGPRNVVASRILDPEA